MIADSALQQLDLDQVLFVPAGSPPHKSGERGASSKDRLAMVELAIADRTEFVSSTLDLREDHPSYTWELLERLQHSLHPARMYFIMGGDSLDDFPTWERFGHIITLADIAVVARRGPEHAGERIEDVPGLQNHLHWVDVPLCDISSTAIRNRIASGQGARYLVPDAVHDYIAVRNLYRR